MSNRKAMKELKKVSLGLKLLGISLEKDVEDFGSILDYVGYQYNETKKGLQEKLNEVDSKSGLVQFLRKVNALTGLAIQVKNVPFKEALELAKMELEDRIDEKLNIIKGDFDETE